MNGRCLIMCRVAQNVAFYHDSYQITNFRCYIINMECPREVVSLNNQCSLQTGINGPTENDLLFQLWLHSSVGKSTAMVS